MSDPCEWVKENAPALVRGLEPPAAVSLHMADCAGCRAVAEGASALKTDLDGWVAPEPPSDLLGRTLARMAMQSPASEAIDVSAADAPATDAPATQAPTTGPRHRRR